MAKSRRKQLHGEGKQKGSGIDDSSIRNRIAQKLREFRASQDEVYTIEDNLDNSQRAVVHDLCRKMGLRSKSSGCGGHRRVCVWKMHKKAGIRKERQKETGRLIYITFSEESKEVLQELFTHYPPGDSEVGDEMIGKSSVKSGQASGNRDDMFCKPSFKKAEIAKKVESLASKMAAPKLKQIYEQRSRLPIAVFKDDITSTVKSHQVVLISGETGCGKTTQVPQFLLDYMWHDCKACKIVCTQPRRISAISVAERISSERGEEVGDTVGYKIRLESKGGKKSSVLFCTNGILLRLLVSNTSSNSDALKKSVKGGISDITHIIVDEIHERDRYSDFMLAILRDMLPSLPHLRLILMSATLDAERFSQYFGGCPIIRVPGFTYPVKTFFLEDVLSMLKSKDHKHHDSNLSVSTEEAKLPEEYRVALDEAINLACTSDEFESVLDLVSSEGTPKVFNFQHSSTGVTPLMVLAGKGRVSDVCMLLSLGADCHVQANDGTTALKWAERENQEEVAELIKKHMENELSHSNDKQMLLDKYLSTINPELIDVVLIAQILRKICADSKDGAILVFLPGWDDINKTREKLLSSPFFSDASKFFIIALHSMVPSMEQKKVFKRPPQGCRKIVLSTNIAETAVTIDDVAYVIDSGRMKEKSYDPYGNVSTLQSSWVSKASAKQREGRAGRCQPGICYHLYSKVQEASLPDFPIPEIKRMPIEELCLQIKLIDPNCKAEAFLQKLLDPPISETIHNAIVALQDIGALSHDESLTQLGEKLGSLPVHPLTSKMLFFAILLNCLGPALTLACASDFKDPFTIPMFPHEKEKAAAAKAELASLYGGHSDQLAVIAAFECWKTAKESGQEKRFCSEYFVSSSTMHMLFSMRKQLQNELVRKGFIPEDLSSCSLNARDPGILHAVLVAGLYPMVGRFYKLSKNSKRYLLETASGDKVRLHPGSSNSKLSYKNFDARPLVIYDEITRGDSGLLTRNCTLIGPLPLLLLATEMAVAPENNEGNGHDDESEKLSNEDDNDNIESEKGSNSADQHGRNIMSSPDNTVKVVVDRWLSFKSTALDAAQIYCLRERLAAATLFKVKHPREVLPPVLGASVFAVACILSYDGLSGIQLPLESVDSLTSMVSAAEIDKSAPGMIEIGQNSNGFLKSPMGHLVRHGRPHYHMTTLPSQFKGQESSDGQTICEEAPPCTSVSMMAQQCHQSQNLSLPKYGFNDEVGFGLGGHHHRSLLPLDIMPQQTLNGSPSLDLHPPSTSGNVSTDLSHQSQIPMSRCNPKPSGTSVSTNRFQRPQSQNPSLIGYGLQNSRDKSMVRPKFKGKKKSGTANCNTQHLRSTSVGMNSDRKPHSTSLGADTNPKPKSKTPMLNGYGLGTYGPYGPRGDSLKRQRGN